MAPDMYILMFKFVGFHRPDGEEALHPQYVVYMKFLFVGSCEAQHVATPCMTLKASQSKKRKTIIAGSLTTYNNNLNIEDYVHNEEGDNGGANEKYNGHEDDEQAW
ncbi:uncharacterized protein LOC109790773 [Cajanus cajan]|uniref:uncharacterized protein LOC109790773 n=1 Tax=Cajanus cajan TaxID=3821 RepID=UPI0010FB5955|nr:uncharacterized protein LOC109790773 [Cajanus cajan]